MRVILKNPKTFFDEVLFNKNLTLRKLAEATGWNYSNLKGYRRGELTLPEEIFASMVKLSLKPQFWMNNMKNVEDNWGYIKAGKISASKGDVFKRMKLARKFRKIVTVNINLNRSFCEFYGALLGDGCISKYHASGNKTRFLINLSGNKKLDSVYFKFLKNMLKEEYGLHSYYYEYKNLNSCVLVVFNKDFCLRLNNDFGVPIGLKYNGIRISDKILELPWDIKKFVLRGLFDTDGCIFARKDESYRLPHVSISSKSKPFLEQICNLLQEQGYPAYVNNSNVRIRGIANVKRWFGDIGSSNPRNIRKYEYFLKHKNLPAGSLR